MVNAGARGHKPKDTLEVIRQKVLNLQPDLIIYYAHRGILPFKEFVGDDFNYGNNLLFYWYMIINSR